MGQNEPMPETQTLLALLSGGPYGVADKVGSINRSLVMRTCRDDGLLLRASKPITMLDAAWRASFAAAPATGLGATVPPPSPRPVVRNVWSTFSQVGRWRWSLVLGLDLPEAFPLSLADLDLVGEHVAAEYWHGLPRAQLTLLSPHGAPLVVPACPSPPRRSRILGSSYTVLAPVLPNGWALLGEPGKLVTVSARRVAALSVAAGGLEARLRAAPGEALELHVLPPAALVGLRRGPAETPAAVLRVRCVAPRPGGADEAAVLLRCERAGCTCG